MLAEYLFPISRIVVTAMFTSFICWCLHYLSMSGYILAFYRRFWYIVFGVTWNEGIREHEFRYPLLKTPWKMIIGCPVCMSSFYGAIIYVLFYDLNVWSWLNYFPIIMASAGLSRPICALMSFMKAG